MQRDVRGEGVGVGGVGEEAGGADARCEVLGGVEKGVGEKTDLRRRRRALLVVLGCWVRRVVGGRERGLGRGGRLGRRGRGRRSG